MKVLWLSSANTLFNEKGDRTYNGKGWIASLQEAVTAYCPDIELAVAFVSAEGGSPVTADGVTYYRFRKRSPEGFRKLIHNWSGGRFRENYDQDISRAVESFRPDIVQVFGCESRLSSGIISIKGVPVAAHIQGILSECLKAFRPKDMKDSDFILPGTFIDEAVLRNGYIRLYEDYWERSLMESWYLSALKFAFGRTNWDREIIRRRSGAEYFHIDEVLRDSFYAAAGSWKAGPGTAKKKLSVMSTISDAPYKGLDVIMKCAAILKKKGFEVHWKVAGIKPGCHLIDIFERKYHISCRESGIHFLGVMDPEGLISAMRESSVFVHPSYVDNSPNSVCEAQMTGMPVIAAAAGGTPTIVEERKTGLLFTPGDAESLAGHIITLSENQDMAAQLGKAAAEKAVQRHDRTAIASRLRAAYSECIKDYPRI